MKTRIYQTIIAVIIVLFLGTAFVVAKDEPKGKPFQAIWEAIDDLQEQINNLVVQPGPIGPQGPPGPPGPPGECSCPECAENDTQECDTGLLGVCAIGTQVCDQDGFWDDCIQNEESVPEICDDGLDNDCDGEVDENCPALLLFEYYNVGDNDVNSVVDPKWEAQTFTPQISHIIKKVRIKIYRLGLPGIVTVGIRATDGEGKPSGADLASGAIDGNTFTTDSSGAWYDIDLGNGTALFSGVKYAIVLGNSASGWARWRVNTNSNYEGGTSLTSLDSGNTWVFCNGGSGVDGAYDTLFEEWGIPLSGIVQDNFNIYTNGSIVGQGDWGEYQNGGNFIVQGATVFEGAKALHNNALADSVIYKAGNSLSDGRQVFYVRTEDRLAWDSYLDGNVQVRVLKGTWGGSQLRNFVALALKRNGNVAYFDPLTYSYKDFAIYNDSEWTLLEIEWRSSDRTARYRVNEGVWTDWESIAGSGSFTDFDHVGIDFVLGGGSGGVYFDTLGKKPLSLFENYTFGDDDVQSSHGLVWEAQTFTPAVSHVVVKIKTKAFRVGSPGAFTVGIRATDGDGKPTGTDLALGSIDGNSFTTDSNGEWYEIDLGVGANLSAGTKYAIVARAVGPEASNRVSWMTDASFPVYGGGQSLTSLDGGNAWALYDYDNMFEEWGI